MVFPLAVAAIGMFASIIGSFLVRRRTVTTWPPRSTAAPTSRHDRHRPRHAGLAYFMFGDIAGVDNPLGLCSSPW
jgi:hypothetical protein